MAANAETPIPSLAARPRRELARHGRPQADRDPLPRHLGALLPRRRGDGSADADAALAGGQRLPDEGLLQRGHDDARHDDGLPRRRPDPRRLRQLPRAADDRRPRHGVPAPERALVLALPLRRRDPDALVLRPGRRRQVGLDLLPAALGPEHRQRPGPLDPRPARALALVARGRDQLHRHDREHADAGDELDADAALHLGDRHLRGAARGGAADAVGGPDAAAARPAGGHELLPARRGRERRALPARLLVLRPPRGLHHGPARLRDHLGDHPRLRTQADLRLQGGRVLDGRDRASSRCSSGRTTCSPSGCPPSSTSSS